MGVRYSFIVLSVEHRAMVRTYDFGEDEEHC